MLSNLEEEKGQEGRRKLVGNKTGVSGRGMREDNEG